MFDLRRALAALCAGFQLPWPSRRHPAAGDAYRCGLAALEGGRAEEALHYFEAAPHTAPRENKRGVALMALGRRPEALNAFCAALECDERCPAALTNIGNLLLEDGAQADAIDYYRAALVSDPAYASAHRNLGVALRRAGQRGRAVKAWRAADRLAGRRGGDRA